MRGLGVLGLLVPLVPASGRSSSAPPTGSTPPGMPAFRSLGDERLHELAVCLDASKGTH